MAEELRLMALVIAAANPSWAGIASATARHDRHGPQHNSFLVKQAPYLSLPRTLVSHLTHLAQTYGLESPRPPNSNVPDGSRQR